MADINSAVDNLIRRGWSDDDIGTIVDQVNQQTDELIRQGRSNEEIESRLNSIKMNDKAGDFSLFQQPKVEFQVSPQQQQMGQQALAQPSGTPISQVEPPTTMQNIMSGPVGGAIESTLRGVARAAPFPGLIKAATGEIAKPTLSDIANPLPEIVTDPLARVIEAIKNVKKSFTIPGTNIEISGPNTAQMIEAAMAQTPAFIAAKNLRSATLPTGRKVPPEIPEKLPQQGPGGPQFPITEKTISTGPLPLTEPRTSVLGQTRTPSEIVGNISTTEPTIPPNIPTTAQIIETASTAKKIGGTIGNIELVKQANEVVNQQSTSVVKPREILEPNLPPLQMLQLGRTPEGLVKIAEETTKANDIAADFNINANNKIQADLTKVAGTKAIREDGTPVEIYTGTIAAYNEPSLEFAKVGSFGVKAIWGTENPKLASEAYTVAKPGVEIQPNVRPSYFNVKNPLEMEAQPDLDLKNYVYNRVVESGSEDLLKRYSSIKDNEGLVVVLDSLNFGRDPNITTNTLKQFGYDGITHLNQAGDRIWAAFDPVQVVSKFDPDLYKTQLQIHTSEPAISGMKVNIERNSQFSDGKTNLTEKQALDNIDIPRENPELINAGEAVIENAKAQNVQGLSFLTDNAGKYLSDEVKERNKLPDGTIPPTIQGGNITANDPLKPPIELPTAAIALPFYRLANKIEAETKIPLLTELYINGRHASNLDIEFKLEKQSKLNEIFKDYLGHKQSNIRARENMADIADDILDYNSKTQQIAYKVGDVNKTGNLAQAARDMGHTIREVETAAKVREFFNDAFKETEMPFEKFLPFYLPRRWRLNPEERFRYMSQFREDQQPFFSYPRKGGNQPRELEKDLYTLGNIYINEWAKAKYLMPWYKNYAEPILDQIVKYPGGSASKPLAYIGHYVEDIMGIPRQGAVNFNETIGNFIKNNIQPRLPWLAEDLHDWLSRDRPGEVLGSKLLKMQYNGALGYRPFPAIRNATQRLFAQPLLPGGFSDLAYGMKKMRTPEGKEILQQSGTFGYLGDLFDKHAVSESHWYSPMYHYQKIENGNRGSIYLSQYYHLLEDLDKGMRPSEIAKKYNFNLFPSVLRDYWMEGLERGSYGDIREVGLEHNMVHSIADWTQLITNFPYDKSGGVELFKTGPIAKQFGAFNSWNFFTVDYMTNLLKEANRARKAGEYHGEGSWKDIGNVAKMFALFTALDGLAYWQFGTSLSSNPITNVPMRPLETPAPSLTKSVIQAITGEWNNMMSNILYGRENEYAKYMAASGWKQAAKTLPVFIPGGFMARNIIEGKEVGAIPKYFFPELYPEEKKKKAKSISP